jgi:hypothetical protein
MEKCTKSDLASVSSSTGDASNCDFSGASLKGMELIETLSKYAGKIRP